MTKYCSGCNTTKPIEAFYPRYTPGKKKRETRCRLCINARCRAYYIENRERLIKAGHQKGATARGKFDQQRTTAMQRGIGWQITFDQWMRVWNDSGHWEQRGRAASSYVMARHGDTGPYAVGNVYICTLSQNCSDQYKWRTHHSTLAAAKRRAEQRKAPLVA